MLVGQACWLTSSVLPPSAPVSLTPLGPPHLCLGGYTPGFQSTPITHILYMDDLKLYKSEFRELEATVVAVKSVAAAMRMSMGVNKCGVDVSEEVE